MTECVVPRLNLGEAELYMNRLALRETTTFLGKAEQETEDTLTDRPHACPTRPLPRWQTASVLNVTGTLIIGGEARDNTFVTQVDVRIDGGPWQAAEGAETWTYAWDTTGYGDGPHTIESRATDAGGNAESPPASVTVIIDRTPPQLAADAPPLKATEDGEGIGPSRSAASSPTPIPPPWTCSWSARMARRDRAGSPRRSPATPGASTTSFPTSTTTRTRSPSPPASTRSTCAPTTCPATRRQKPPTRRRCASITPRRHRLTFPFSDTAALTDTSVFITGVVTDVGSVTYGVGRVEIAFQMSRRHPPLDWHDALLAPPGNITSTWAYTLPTPVEGFYEIYLRGTDVLDNRNEQQSTWIAWQGMIDTENPRVDANILYNVMGNVTWGATSVITYSDVTCQAHDLTLDSDALHRLPLRREHLAIHHLRRGLALVPRHLQRHHAPAPDRRALPPDGRIRRRAHRPRL